MIVLAVLALIGCVIAVFLLLVEVMAMRLSPARPTPLPAAAAAPGVVGRASHEAAGGHLRHD